MLNTILGRKQRLPATVTPPELARMMRRYGIGAPDIDSMGCTEDFAGAWRACAACDRKPQCREWLDLAPPMDIPLFCCNENFFNRVKHAKANRPPRA